MMVVPTSPTPDAAPPRPAELECVLERITYANEDTGYTVARVATAKSGSDLLTVVGALLGAQVGESLRLTGRWRSHPKYGKQFEADSYTTVLPATVQGIRRYLGSGMIKGIGPVMADRMVEHFGTDILRVIEEEPDRLVEVQGLGPKRTKRIGEAWEEQKAIKEVMVFLQGVGVSTSLAVRIYKQYGDKSVDTVRKEPYRLASDVWGIGFKTADTIAQAVGIPHDSPERIKAGLQYTLSEAADDGHCFLPEPNLVTAAEKILGVPRELVVPALDELARDEGVVREPIPGRGRTRRRSRRSTWSRSTAPSGPSPAACWSCSTPRPTGSRRSPTSTGTRPSRGCGGAPARPSRPSRRTPSSSPSPRRCRC